MEAFAKELAEVRNLDTKDKYKGQLDKLETEYQYVCPPTLTHFLSQRDGPVNPARKAAPHQGTPLWHHSRSRIPRQPTFHRV